MAEPVSVDFLPWSALRAVDGDGGGPTTLVVFAGDELSFGAPTRTLIGDALKLVQKAARVVRFVGRAQSALDLLVVDGVGFDRILVIGTGRKPGADSEPVDYARLGGYVMEKSSGRVYVAFDFPEAPPAPAEAAANFMLGVRLRDYKFDRYKTKKKDEGGQDQAGSGDGRPSVRMGIALEANEEAQERAQRAAALADGVTIARTLVNEPPNVLFPIEFANRARELEKLGVTVDILDVPALERIGMRALLGVGQGSRHESRVVVMRWNGAADASHKPVAFLGKGVCFDTGGISIKPAANMEDMKGDMAGAACVVGLFHTLAARKARVNAVGAIGLVENMPGGAAQRPGDIVRSLSGQTIEIINTDAEGRLVLADLLWHVNQTYQPQFMVDLATLTGAILVALGNEHAGLFANDDELAKRLEAAGLATGEKLWRLPLAPAYDKLIDSKFADVKNVGGRHAGSITAAQFLQRFVKERPWAHLDIAGVGMGSPQTEINQSWGSGWGVRLLDRLVSDYYEA